jgi:hypothetical protein
LEGAAPLFLFAFFVVFLFGAELFSHRPEEFAQLVVSMLENAYLNGETIRLDGGIRMSPM